jgi:hypothetical protein
MNYLIEKLIYDKSELPELRESSIEHKFTSLVRIKHQIIFRIVYWIKVVLLGGTSSICMSSHALKGCIFKK